MLPRLPLRYILADDPGAGKTITTGLFLREPLARGDLGYRDYRAGELKEKERAGKPGTFAADAASRRAIELTAMKAVMDIETSLGYIPRDVSAAKLGYDIESSIPQSKREASGTALRFIEVKGRAPGAQTVAVSKNEILTALNKPEEYILAIVEVDNGDAKVVYLKKPSASARTSRSRA
jgi:hypothetical protein